MSAVHVSNLAHNLRPLAGYFGKITVSSSAVSAADMVVPGGAALAVSDSCTHVLLQFEVANVRERADGTAPTTSVGRIRTAGDVEVIHVRDFNARKWIRDDSTDATIWVQQLASAT